MAAAAIVFLAAATQITPVEVIGAMITPADMTVVMTAPADATSVMTIPAAVIGIITIPTTVTGTTIIPAQQAGITTAPADATETLPVIHLPWPEISFPIWIMSLVPVDVRNSNKLEKACRYAGFF